MQARKTVLKKIRSLENNIARIRAKERSRILSSLGVPTRYHSGCQIYHGRGYRNLWYLDRNGYHRDVDIDKNAKETLDALTALDINAGS